MANGNCPWDIRNNCEACGYERFIKEKNWYECFHPESINCKREREETEKNK